MNASDRDAFAELIGNVLGFYGQKISSFALDVWWQACQSFSLDEVSAALTRHATNPESGQFAPKPADLIRELRGTPSDRAAKAWSALLDAMQRIGSYTDVVFDDPIIHVVVMDLGGWPTLCRTETAQLSYHQHRFTEAYRAYSRRGDLTEWPRRLTGDRSPDDEFERFGLKPPRPVLIGDAKRALAVLEGGGDGLPNRMTLLTDALQNTLKRIGTESKEDAA